MIYCWVMDFIYLFIFGGQQINIYDYNFVVGHLWQ